MKINEVITSGIIYDNYNRLKAAEFDTANYDGDYSTTYFYNDRGNPTRIKRYGIVDKSGINDLVFGKFDEAAMSYDGNQLIKVNSRSDAMEYEGQTGIGHRGISYLTYDAAGRLTSDGTRDIVNIEYDNNGYPVSTEFEDGSSVYDYYDGMGNHLATDIYEAESVHATWHDREYTGSGLIIENNKPQIERVPGGYFDFATKTFRYYITDYQGNNVAVTDSQGKLLEQTDYYPYGEPWQEPDHPFTYSDNERLHTFGQNQYDFHARRLISSLLRFDKPDPLMEKYPWLSPYTFCGGNPIMYTDHDGLKFTERAEEVVTEYENLVNSKIESAEKDLAKQQSRLENAKNEKQKRKIEKKIAKINDVKNEMKAILNELSVLRESDQSYDIAQYVPVVNEYVPTDITGKTEFENGVVVMTIPNNEISLLAHELKHAYQFETGKMNFGVRLDFTDITDEIEAHERGSYFGQNKNGYRDKKYEKYSKTENSLDTYYHGIDVKPEVLEHLSINRKIIFRWRGKTYSYK
ncbi:MAG: hypothetical protein K2M07_05145 [Muribaculaceae bacterium]|nr:hypothetical protein [Muribaculaceae bacterium]